MTSTTTTSRFPLVPSLETAWQDVDGSFERFCLTAWGKTKGKIGFHGGKVTVHRPRVRDLDGHELPLPTWTAALDTHGP